MLRIEEKGYLILLHPYIKSYFFPIEGFGTRWGICQKVRKVTLERPLRFLNTLKV